MKRILATLAVLVFADALTTYLLTLKYPAQLEFNPILRHLLVIDRRLVFAWMLIEYAGLLSLFYLSRYVRKRLKIKKRLEHSVIALVVTVVVLNIIGLLLNR